MPVQFSFNHRKSADLKKRADSPLSGNGFSLKGENGAATVILIHGLTGTSNEMRYTANSLHRKGYTVICPKLANHGEPMAILKETTWQDFYQSIKGVFLEVEGSAKGGPIFIGGLCIGALLGLLLADEFGARISAVSCLSVTLFYDGWNVPWYRILLPIFYWTPILKDISYYKEDSPYGIKDEAIRERVHQYYSRASLDDMDGMLEHGYPYIPASLFYQNHLLIKHVTKRLSSVEVPVQLIQAKDDDTTGVKNSEFVYHRIKSRIKELILLEDSYHVITVDREREKVAQKMDEFFSRTLVRI